MILAIFCIRGCLAESKPPTPHDFSIKPTFEEIGKTWPGNFTACADPPLITPEQAKQYDKSTGTLVVTGYPNDADWHTIRFEKGLITIEEWSEKLIAKGSNVSSAIAKLPARVKFRNNTTREAVQDVKLPGNRNLLRDFVGSLNRFERSGSLYDLYSFRVIDGKVTSWSVRHDYEGD